MLTITRTIRVFISSTLSDLKAERNALKEQVFPRLKRYCQRRGWSFQGIDLRWRLPAKETGNETASFLQYCRQPERNIHGRIRT